MAEIEYSTNSRHKMSFNDTFNMQYNYNTIQEESKPSLRNIKFNDQQLHTPLPNIDQNENPKVKFIKTNNLNSELIISPDIVTERLERPSSFGKRESD